MQNFDPQNLTDEILELLDLYIVGALDEDEIAQVKNILSVSIFAQTYVDEGRNDLASLEPDSSSDPVLFESIKEKISSSNSVVEIAAAPSVVKKRKVSNMAYLAVAASIIAIFVSIALIVTSVNDNPTLSANGKKNMKEQLSVFSKSKSTHTLELQGAGNDTVNVMMNDNGDVMVDGRDLDKLSKYETYQLWAIIEDKSTAEGVKVISASVLGNAPDISMTHIDGKVKGFAITKEVSGGVTSSSNEPMYAHLIA